MGGNIVVNYALRKKHQLKGVIASSPFLKLAFQPPAWKLFFGKILQKIAPSITLGNELNPSYVTRDESQIENYTNDPLIHNKISPNYSLTFFKTGEWAIENAAKLTVPMFVLHGTDDKIIDYKGSESFTKNTTFASLKLFENGYHELHNDICKEAFFLEVINWLKQQI